MSLRHKMSVQIACMIAGLLLTSAAGLWGINGLHDDYGSALVSSNQFREAFEVGSHLITAAELFRAAPDDRLHAAEQVGKASDLLQLSFAKARLDSDDDRQNAQSEADLALSIKAAASQLNRAPDAMPPDERRELDQKSVEDAIGQVRTFAAGINTVTKARKAAADQRRRDTILAVELICGFVVAAAIVLGVLQYRSVLLPLHRIAQGVRKIAAGQFAERLDERGNEEFSTLANEFNRMAAELDEFYNRLEQKVADKSKELIRSERLASVGYLAAGVAHEINNPLGIISGYAEYSLSQLKRQSSAGAPEDIGKSLQIICDEAFRCKDIIGKLLSLARPGEGSRQLVDLAKVASDVTSAVAGLRNYADRKLVVVAGDGVMIDAIETEMKQIMLNLTLNALEAVSPGGEVRIEVTRNHGWAELRVRDDGRGMTEQTLDRIFEPFFTDKRGVREPGTGLGLSITHAIVVNHGGTIRASSRGPGKGSEFVVRLPAAAERSVA
jgi:signal transduction histidine kinase